VSTTTAHPVSTSSCAALSSSSMTSDIALTSPSSIVIVAIVDLVRDELIHASS
jgi:hypothetical protein